MTAKRQLESSIHTLQAEVDGMLVAAKNAEEKSKKAKKEKDERDPLFHGIKDTGAEDWGSLLKEGVQNSREKISKMKEAQPLTFSQVTMQGAKFGYKTYSFGGWYGGALMTIFISLFGIELWYQYLDNT